MEQVIMSMLEQYQCQSEDDYVNALKEIIQEVALLGLWRAKFFEHAAFYGGTALRILYQLDRFSEDLDFSLLKPNEEFNLNRYHDAVIAELESFGFEVQISLKEKTKESAIQSAFLKANTQEHLLRVQTPAAMQTHCHGRELIKIKFEVDTNPPDKFSTETKQLLRPIPFGVNCYSLPDLFAGKICAVLCRQWQKRIKGRDWYDFLWFIQRGTPMNLVHLETRLREAHFYTEPATLTQEKVLVLLKDRFSSSEVDLAKNDIMKYIKDPSRLDGWSTAVFIAATDEMKFI
jgi:predicted nucleotidyltransferase component of viral defense system